MRNFSPPINPYAPPASIVSVPRTQGSFLWREEDRLVIRHGAKLPPYCMVTGAPAPYSHPVCQFWQPRWVYSLLIFAVVPYFIFSPFLLRRVELMVPFGRSVYRQHRRWVSLGILLMLAGGLLVAGFVASIMGQWLSQPVAMILVLGVVLFLIGLQIASSQPMRLNITKVEDDVIFVDNVHPEYLARLPDILELAPAESQ